MWWTLLSTISTGFAAVIAISIISIQLYKTHEKEKKRRSGKSSSPNDDPKGNGSPPNDDTKGNDDSPPNDDPKGYESDVCKTEKKTNDSPKGDEPDVCETEKKTKGDGPNDGSDKGNLPNDDLKVNPRDDSHGKSNEPDACKTENKTKDNPPDELKKYDNGFDLDESVSSTESITSDETEITWDSTESITSAITPDLIDHAIPTWNEMSDKDRKSCLCIGCEKEPVSTITIPCDHPYLCMECAPFVFVLYQKCLCCQKKILSFIHIED